MDASNKFLTRMTIFVILVMIILAFLFQQLTTAFLANPAINGAIGFALLIGIVYAYRRVFDLKPEVRWIKAFQKRQTLSAQTPPRLMASAAKLLSKDKGEDGEALIRLSGASMRSVLDGIATRLEESQEVSKYLTGILVLLGLLGTFWGLLNVLPAIASTIRGLTVDGSDTALMFDELKAGLEGPLGGMATAFSSSLFGLAGSLILGFLDLQAGQAQTRFYNDVEDWLASVTRLSRASEDGFASPSSYMTALMEQTADGIDRLTRTLNRSEQERRDEAEISRTMAEVLSKLADRLGQNSANDLERAERERMMVKNLETIAARNMPASQSNRHILDEASREHLRNMDVGIKRLTDQHSRASDRLGEDLRAEIKLLSRTLSRVIDDRGQPLKKKPSASGAFRADAPQDKFSKVQQPTAPLKPEIISPKDNLSVLKSDIISGPDQGNSTPSETPPSPSLSAKRDDDS